ncbi:MAG: MotA/TolQ/ExbB proton channel family protein [Chlamydiae bacterium]|nr:MotA/TolQ/ExbB proton channel family protein [Chlamydiota bacterium]
MFLLATSPFFTAYLQSDIFGKGVYWSLLLMSIISWVVLIHKIWLSRKLRSLSSQFSKIIENKKETLLSLNIEAQMIHPYFEIFKTLKEKTLEILNKNRFFIEKEKNHVYVSSADIELIQSHIDAVISDQAKILEKNLFVLSTIVTLGPFLGLLGTVWGILVTFSGLQNHASITSNSSVLGGLALALSTTIMGLVVAIPALVAYNYLKTVARDFTIDMENFSSRLMATIEIQYRKVD